MNKKLSTFTAIALVLTTGCGGGSSSSNSPQEQLFSSPFTFKVMQENECGQIAPIENVEFLIYDESPNINPDSSYTVMNSDSQGLIELDLDDDETTSLTLNAARASGGTTSYSFIELAAGHYNITVLFDDQSYINDQCTCQQFNTSAVAASSNVQNISLYGGSHVQSGYVSNSGPSVSFTEYELCGIQEFNSPIIVSATDAQLPDMKFYGVLDNPSINTISDETISMNEFSMSIDKPAQAEAYELNHSVIINNANYLEAYYLESDSKFTPYEELDVDWYYFSALKGFESTFNGIEDSNEYYVSGRKYKRKKTQSSSGSDLGNLPTGSVFNITHDEATGLVTWQTDSTDTYDITYVSRHYKPLASSSNSLSWYTYGPNYGQVQLPKNTPEIESLISNSQMYFTVNSLINVDDATGFADSIALRRFNNAQGVFPNGPSDSILTTLYYSFVSTKSELNSKLSKGEIENLLSLTRED